VDKKEAEAKISSLTQALYQYNQQSEKSRGKKPVKPFISTVRSHTLFPDPAFISDIKDKCSCGAFAKKPGINKEIEKLRSDLKHCEDVISILKKQEGEKDREIQRLNCLLVGGRPASALAKDCCYKDVSKITEDVSVLQRDKIKLQAKLQEYVERTEKLLDKSKSQKQKIESLEAHIAQITDAALYVEKEANLRIKNQKRDIAELKENITKGTSDFKSQEIKGLKRTLKEKNQLEQKLSFEIEYLKNKLKENEQQISSNNSQLVAELVKERDVLQNRLKLLGEGNVRLDLNLCESSRIPDECRSVHGVYLQLKEKEAQIQILKEELQCLRCEKLPQNGSAASLTMANHLRRAECERDCALNKVQSMKIENEALNDKVRIISDSKLKEGKRIIQLEETIAKLKMEIKDLQSSKTPTVQTIKQLREENCELQIKLRSSDEDYKKLNCTYNQVKMLSQQTESVLMNAQNQLEFTKCELSERDAQICCLSKSNECLKDQIEKSSIEIAKLKSLKSTVEREKEFYMMTLDKKNEKLQSAESKVETMAQLRETNRVMKSQLE
jgi:centrosomal protein CEP135